MRQLVILGDPGSGKTTTLWRIAADAATTALKQPSQPLPVFVRFGEMHEGQTLRDHIAAQLGDDLSAYYDALVGEGHLMFLLDGLNELPAKNKTWRASLIQTLRELVKGCQDDDRVVAVTCRELDYTQEVDLHIAERVQIEPLNPLQIRTFVNNYIAKPAGKGDELFWQLAGEQAERTWGEFQKWHEFKSLDQPDLIFWLEEALPRHKDWGTRWNAWLRERRHPRSMLTLARNPYMLFMMTRVFTRQKRLPQNRGLLFAGFVDYLLHEREHLPPDIATDLKNRLSDLAYSLQAQREGTGFTEEQALTYLGDETNLYRARSTNILTTTAPIRFTHQLLQEYFAARKLDEMMKAGKPATDLWPPAQWWEPTGWEETAILLAGLYSDDCTDVLTWLRDANPHLAARCAVESGASTPDSTKTTLQQQWLPRLTNHHGEPDPHSRAGVGRGLGLLNLDSRKGVGVKDGLPDIDWVQIPAGEFIYGSDKAKDPQAPDNEMPQRTLHLETFYISRYPITYTQFQVFVEATDGFNDPRWWEGLADDEYRRRNQTQVGEQRFKYANHPRENVSWYDAMAFCRWWSWRITGVVPSITEPLTWAIRLPTEFEWEKAARGTDGRIYPWGNDYISGYANIDETENNVGPYYLRQTSAVGMYPQGASPYGVLDMSGNVWEWCLTDYSTPDRLDISNTNSRVLRGGSWNNFDNLARAARRDFVLPDGRGYDFGGRVVCVRPPSP